MNLAVSNIAWPVELDSDAADLLVASGIAGVEIAPTRRWPDLSRRDRGDVTAVRQFWELRGLPIVALQALLFGRTDLTLFGSPAERHATLDYLTHALDLAADLGARWLVFGSPRNRLAGDRPRDEVFAIARDFFLALGDRAVTRNAVVGIEANPPEYGCDFLTRTAEAVDFVRSLDHRGIGCHLDLGGMTIAGEPVAPIITGAVPIGYVHASAPHLQSIAGFAAVQRDAGDALRAIAYDGWVSIEMRSDGTAPLAALEEAIATARSAYAG